MAVCKGLHQRIFHHSSNSRYCNYHIVLAGMIETGCYDSGGGVVDGDDGMAMAMVLMVFASGEHFKKALDLAVLEAETRYLEAKININLAQWEE